MNDGVLVSRQWLERVNLALFGSSELPKGATADAGSRFYDVRLVQIRTGGGWTYTGGEWVATASFVVNNALVTDFSFPLYAPIYTGSSETKKPHNAAGTRLFAVWRGRWEALQDRYIITTYTGGTGIYIDPISNEISTSAVLGAELIQGSQVDPNYATLHNGKLQFDKTFFEFGNTYDSVGQMAVKVKVSDVTVITGVNFDAKTVTTKSVKVVGTTNVNS